MTSGATCCPMARDPDRGSPARGSHGPRTLRDEDPAGFVTGVTGRRIEGVGRRGKNVLIDLDGGAFLTVHLKMTGQLFVVPAGLPVDPYERAALVLDDGREIRFRDVRKFGRIGLYVADDDPFDDLGPEPLDPRFTLRAWRARLRGRRARLKPLLVDQSFVVGIGNIYADEALWRSRLHPLRSAASLRPAEERALYRNVREILGEAVERRGSSIDDYTAPDGDGEMQERLDVYQRTGQPCPRCGRPIRRIVIGIRATHFCSFCQRLPAAQRPAAARLLATMTPRPGRAASGRRGRPVGGARRRGVARADDRRGRRGPCAGVADEGGGRRTTGRGEGRGGAPRRRAGRRATRRAWAGGDRMSLVRLEGVVREIGTFVILDQVDAAIAVGERMGLVGPNGAGKTTLLRIVAGRDEADRGTVTRRRQPVPRAAQPGGALRRGVHGRARTCAPRSGTAPRTSSGWPRSSSTWSTAGHAGGNRYAELQHRFEVLGGYTLDQRVDSTMSGLGFAPGRMDQAATALSGGEQTRAALGRLYVIADPEGHISTARRTTLTSMRFKGSTYRKRRAGALLVALAATRHSSMRRFPGSGSSDRSLTVFPGDYSQYHRQREERDAADWTRMSRSRRTSIARERGARPALPEPQEVWRGGPRPRGRGWRTAPGRAGSGAQGRQAPPGSRPRHSGQCDPSRSGEIVVRGAEGLLVGYLPRFRRERAASRRGEKASLEGPDAGVEPGGLVARWRGCRSSQRSAVRRSGSSARTGGARGR